MNSEKSTILCIEDDPDTCELIVFTLGLSGYQVEPAHSIQEGLSKAREKRYALYSVDSKLPDGSGVELCMQLRKFDPSTPILFYSGDAFPDQIKMAMGAGAQAYLVKPTDPDDLIKTVAQLLGQATSYCIR
jgi:DNA-binding response OmpR family regulator